MPREDHSMSFYKWRLLPDFRSTMGYLPKRHQLLPCTRFYTVNGSICSRYTTSQEVCRVFVLQCRSTSYLTSLVSSRRVHLLHTNIYNHKSYIYTFIHPCINTFICSYLHTFMRTQHIHNINLHMVALVTQSLGRLQPSVSILNYHVSSGQS